MASLLRVAARQGCRLISSNLIRQRKIIQPIAFISTSKKNKDSSTLTGNVPQAPAVEENLEEKDENWISYGYSLTDRNLDEWVMHMMMFVGITIVFCWGGFYIAYLPDFHMHDWAQREAYMELARREQEGLPLIDPNLIPEDKMVLPSDEELGDYDIIV